MLRCKVSLLLFVFLIFSGLCSGQHLSIRFYPVSVAPLEQWYPVWVTPIVAGGAECSKRAAVQIYMGEPACNWKVFIRRGSLCAKEGVSNSRAEDQYRFMA